LLDAWPQPSRGIGVSQNMSAIQEPTRVLVVDDEHAIADTMAMILAASHFEARAAYSALEALSLLDTFTPHAVITDVMMPGMTGIELALHLGDRLPLCKVLLMSGYNSAFELVEQSLQGAYCPTILCKPVRPQQILAFVQSCDPNGPRPAA